jgi:hypothetical protein
MKTIDSIIEELESVEIQKNLLRDEKTILSTLLGKKLFLKVENLIQKNLNLESVYSFLNELVQLRKLSHTQSFPTRSSISGAIIVCLSTLFDHLYIVPKKDILADLTSYSEKEKTQFLFRMDQKYISDEDFCFYNFSNPIKRGFFEIEVTRDPESIEVYLLKGEDLTFGIYNRETGVDFVIPDLFPLLQSIMDE